jgi:ribosomal protein S18 acetylase RimI-like enzyme
MDPSIRAKLDRHLIAARTKLYRTIPGGSYEIMRDWTRAYSALAATNFNIFQPLTPTGLNDETLADTAAYFSSLGTLYCVELIHDRFPEGPDYLDQLGYQALPPQLAMALNGQHDPTGLPCNAEVQVEHIVNVPALTAFCTLLHEVFDYALDDMIKFFSVRHLQGELRDRIRHYLAFMDEQPVGAGTSICLDGVASVWNVCTIDAYRQRGVATSLVNHMLNEADQIGCPLKMLYSTPHAYTLFDRFNFEIYSQQQWFLPPGLDYQDQDQDW